MISNREEWNSIFKKLKSLIDKPNKNLSQIIELSIDLNKYTHESTIPYESVTLEDKLWQKDGNFTSFTEKKLYSVAWHLWHSVRIEDITCSHLICKDREIIDEFEFVNKMNIPFRNTGNSMDFSEMGRFNAGIDLKELRNYRHEVGKKTQKTLESLTHEKLKEKIKPESVSEIMKIGSVANTDVWLLDYWGEKNISGIIMMPLTRHLLVHLNSAMRLL
jgi:hypothetical protein